MKKLLVLAIAIFLMLDTISAFAQSIQEAQKQINRNISEYYEICESTCQSTYYKSKSLIEDCIKKLCENDLKNRPKEEEYTSSSLDKLKEENEQLKAEVEKLKTENEKYKINEEQQERKIEQQKTVERQKKKKIKAKKEKNSEESCYQLGYRYGRCGAMALKGYQCDPADDIVMPERCRGSASDRGLRDGAASVW